VALMLAFLVKFPLFLTHAWLPKAHVEAPVSGSMVLAGVLLKLGGYGLYRLAFLYSLSFVNLAVAVIGAVGGSLLGILCCRASDIKVMIAYSSVVHMALIIFNLLAQEKIGLTGAWWVILAHGLVSSAMFAGANILYERAHSRSLLLNKGFTSLGPAFSVFWFLVIIINFAGPFTLNLFGEIVLIVGAFSVTKIAAFFVGAISFFSAAYSLLLYTSTQQGLPLAANFPILDTTPREVCLIFGHTWPNCLILLRLGI
jgi:NADH-ubiquinone oxidoreductase chain 4